MVLSGFLNEVQQVAMQVQFYVWTTQQDSRVRSAHAERSNRIFRWDDPPEGGHPTQDFGCRCYARALSVEGYWVRVGESVEIVIKDLEYWEGHVDHMYLDSNGNVTVGRGKLLPDAASAAALPFRFRTTDLLASAAEIGTEFDLIAGIERPDNASAGYFEPFSQLYLPQSDIDRLVVEHMRGDFRALLRLYPGFGNYPLAAQIALWDMLYNLGPPRLAEYPSMRRAILEGDWELAARESARTGIGDERNQHVFDLFMEAAGN